MSTDIKDILCKECRVRFRAALDATVDDTYLVAPPAEVMDTKKTDTSLQPQLEVATEKKLAGLAWVPRGEKGYESVSVDEAKAAGLGGFLSGLQPNKFLRLGTHAYVLSSDGNWLGRVKSKW